MSTTWRTWAAWAIVAVLATILGVFLVLDRAGSDAQPTPTAAPTTPSESPGVEPSPWTPPPVPDLPPIEGDDFHTVVEGLLLRIHYAFNTRDLALLDEAINHQCSCYEEERAKIIEMINRDYRHERDEPDLVGVEVVERPSEVSVVLRYIAQFPRTIVADAHGNIILDTEQSLEVEGQYVLIRFMGAPAWSISQHEVYRGTRPDDD